METHVAPEESGCHGELMPLEVSPPLYSVAGKRLTVYSLRRIKYWLQGEDGRAVGVVISVRRAKTVGCNLGLVRQWIQLYFGPLRLH